MVFDVDRLKEALRQWDAGDMLNSDIAALADVARLVVAGQPLWWCEEHRCSVIDGWDKCAYHGLILRDTGEPTLHPCVLVEWWLSPTGKDETS